MIVKLLRSVGAVAAGVVVVFILVVAVEFFSAIVHPFPEDFDESHEEICEHVKRYPAWVLAVIVFLWGGTALAGTWTAGKLGNRGSTIALGLLLLAGVLFNISMLPYPLWFKITGPLAVAIGIGYGIRLSTRRATTAVNSA